MHFSRLRPSPAMAVAFAALVLAAGGVAVGSTAVRGHSAVAKKIVACVEPKTEVLRLAPKGRCAKGTRRIAWYPGTATGPQGPDGPPGLNGFDGLDGPPGADGVDGAPGPAAAAVFGHVNADGTLDAARSKNVTAVSEPAPAAAGTYCLDVAAPVVNVVATLDGNVSDDADARPIIRVSLTKATGCPDATDVTVRILDSGGGVAKPFFFVAS